jgi:hypothetical protein
MEQVDPFKCLGCNIAIYRMNTDPEENIRKYSSLNGGIKYIFGERS